MIFAIIPAAGKSTRMGRPKLSLPLGSSTVLGCVIGALRAANVDQIVVVVGPHVAELASLTEAAGAASYLLLHETPDMRATVEHGLRWLEERFRPRPEDAWLLVPADQPLLRPAVVASLLNARRADPSMSIWIPTFAGRRGHPALIGWKHVEGIRAFAPGQGLNLYLRRQRAETAEVPTDADDILIDLDTPADYERLRQTYSG